jgi:cytochrome c-type biogenesis protein CcmE
MKRSQVIALLVIAVALGAIITSVTDSSSYASFEEAFANKGTEYHVVGELDRSSEIEYDPKENPNVMSFYMKDRDGNRRKVILNRSKPNDFERSEKIVLIGSAKEDAFYATDILLKCPSKYEDEKQLRDMEKKASLERESP